MANCLTVDVSHITLTPGTTGRKQHSAETLETDCRPVKILLGVLLPTHNTRFILTTKPPQAEISSAI